MESLTALCRPRTSLDSLYPEAEVAALRAWMRAGTPGPALATAVSGSGLTTLITLLTRENGLECVWVGCATQRVKALLAAAGANPVSVTLRRKIIVVDEVDALGSVEGGMLADVLAFARSSPVVPVLLAAKSTRSQKSLEYAKGWPRFDLGKPAPAVVRAYVRRMADAHGVNVDDDTLTSIVRATRGDLRAALTTLDSLRMGGGSVTQADVQRHVKDETDDSLDLVEAVLRGHRADTVQDALKVHGMGPAIVPMGLYENYLANLGKGDLEAAAAVARDFADADVIDRYMYARQAWDTMDGHYATAAVAAPALHTRALRRGKPSATVTVTKFGSVWSKMYNMFAKTKHVRRLAQVRAEAGLTPFTACELGLVRSCMKAALDRGDEAALADAVGGLPTPALALQMVRLAPGGTPWYGMSSSHATVKRVMARR